MIYFFPNMVIKTIFERGPAHDDLKYGLDHHEQTGELWAQKLTHKRMRLKASTFDFE